MELRRYWNLILKNLAVVLVLVFLGGTSGLLFSLATPKMYKAESEIFIATPSPSIDIAALAQGSSFAQQRVISYAKVVTGPITLVPVIKELALDMSSSELASKISTSAPLGTVLINIDVTDISPIRAAAIANAVAIQFGETVKTLELPQFGDSSGVKATMVRSAEAPKSPSTPNTKLNVLTGFFFGFAIACVIGIIREIFDSSVKNAKHLAGKSLLATIFFDPEAEASPILSPGANYSIRSESFRHLRTSLRLPKEDSICEVIAVTSAFPAEGKTTTSINLAISYAQIGLKVALIEADMRRPTFHKYFGTDESDSIGLSEVLNLIDKGKKVKNFEKFFQSYGDSEDCIEWLKAGSIPANPAERLDSAAMSIFISSLRNEFDIVIFDTPPALPVTDSAVLATKVDGMLIVTRAGVTKQSHVAGVVEILENLNAKILGVILNMVPLNARGEEYGYSYNRYDSKSKYGYNYGYGTSEPYGPIVIQSNQQSNSDKRVPLDAKIRNRLRNRNSSSNQKNPDHISELDSSVEASLAEIRKRLSQ